MRDLATTLLSALVGALAAYLAARFKNSADLRYKVDESLRGTRIELYTALWKLTGMLPQWPRATDVSSEQLLDLSRALKTWYFDGGGMFLSTPAREAYGELQQTLSKVIATHATGQLSTAEYDLSQGRCNRLRVQLTRDLASRTRAFL